MKKRTNDIKQTSIECLCLDTDDQGFGGKNWSPGIKIQSIGRYQFYKFKSIQYSH